jgi:hypothetical protein
MKRSPKLAIKLASLAVSIAILSACGGGDSGVVIVTDHAFLSVDNLNVGNGTVCVEDIFLEASSAQGQQVARDLIDYYGTYDFGLRPIHNAYSAPTYCGGPTSNYVPAPGIIISANDYYNVIVPWVTARR